MIKIIASNERFKMISDHVMADEFECTCHSTYCRSITYSTVLMQKFEELRKLCGNQPIYISSGFRCAGRNFAVNGSRCSYHQMGMAMDLVYPEEMDSKTFIDMCGRAGFTYIKPYIKHVHVDVRELD